jgi:hypothetical protein
MKKSIKSSTLRLIDFVNKLIHKPSGSAIDMDALLIQQESLKKKWDNPEEDIYNTND